MSQENVENLRKILRIVGYPSTREALEAAGLSD
jgi:hypothetical protein